VTPVERFSVYSLGGFSPDWFGANEEIYYEASYQNRRVTNMATTEQIFPAIPRDLPQEDANGNIIVDATGAPMTRLTVRAVRGRRAMPDVIRMANAAGLDVTSVRVREPDLEAVFLNLTGRELRD